MIFGSAAVLGASVIGSRAIAQTHRGDTEDGIAQAQGIVPMPAGNDAELRSLGLEELLKKLGVPGMSIAVLKDRKIDGVGAYGVRDAASGAPVTTDTRFQAASISKPLTAMTILRLAEQGRLSIDRDVNDYLKGWKVPASAFTRDRPVTARALMSHVSGADDGFGFPGYAPGERLPTLAEILDGKTPSNVGPVRFARVPFEGHKYSGGGYVILQLMLTDLLGFSFERIMQDTLLQPLGMDRSSFVQPPAADQGGDFARAHGADGKPLDQAWHVYPEQSSAGLWTTATDLAQVIIEVQKAAWSGEGCVLGQASAREAITPTGVGPFAAGFRLITLGDGWYFYHGGSNFGFEAHIRGHIRKGYGLVIMTNAQESGSAMINEVGSRVADLYGWDGANASG